MNRHITEATGSERQEFAECVDMLRFSLPYPVSSVDDVWIMWDDRMNTANGVLGSYSILHPDRILLASHARMMTEVIMPTLCHELHHHWQYHKFGLLYVLGCIPIIREFVIEKTADAVEDAAETALGIYL